MFINLNLYLEYSIFAQIGCPLLCLPVQDGLPEQYEQKK